MVDAARCSDAGRSITLQCFDGFHWDRGHLVRAVAPFETRAGETPAVPVHETLTSAAALYATQPRTNIRKRAMRQRLLAVAAATGTLWKQPEIDIHGLEGFSSAPPEMCASRAPSAVVGGGGSVITTLKFLGREAPRQREPDCEHFST